MANLKMCYSKESGEWMLLNKVAFLDPRFSRLVQRNPISDSLSRGMMDNETDSDCTQRREKAASPALSAIGNLFGYLYKTNDSGSDVGFLEMQALHEGDFSFCRQQPPALGERHRNPVERHRHPMSLHQSRYLKLSKLAHKYLCVPGPDHNSNLCFLQIISESDSGSKL